MLYISSQTQKIHRGSNCSVTRRNFAQNLQTSTSAAELAEMGYVGCKRCGADLDLAQALASRHAASARSAR
jgi:methylphosphotriester-DNA--protein-cysteine methyltransferase